MKTRKAKTRILSTLLAICLTLALLPGTALAANKSGKCGNNLTWTLSGSTLTISGSGAMWNWGGLSTAPWYENRTDIKTVRIGNGVTTIGDYAFSYSNLTSVTLPNSVTSIGKHAFADCRKLSSITLPSSLTSIGEYAFEYCDMTSLTIPAKVTKMGARAFYGCFELKNVTILNGATTIGELAFWSCSALTSVTIPASVTRIGDGAFFCCESLTSITIPANAKLDGNPVPACSKLTKINLASGNKDYIVKDNVLFNKNMTELIGYAAGKPDTSYSVPKGVVSIQDTAFSWAANLTGIAIPTSVTRIGEGAFRWCDKLKDVYYSGSKAQWDKIIIENDDYDNLELLNAAKHYNSVLPSTSKTLTVTFDPNSGTTPTKTKTVTNGSTYGALPTPTRTGYKFDGWYTSKTGGAKVTSTTKVSKTANHTLYAHWTKPRTFFVELDANGGQQAAEYLAVTTGLRYRSLPTPTRANYHFDGWYTKAAGGVKVTAATKVSSGATTLYAHWTKTNPTVKKARTGSYQIVIPENYPVLLYAGETTATAAKTAVAQTAEYTVICTKTAELSNGTVRYYGKFPKVSNTVSYWFTFSDEMFVNS